MLGEDLGTLRLLIKIRPLGIFLQCSQYASSLLVGLLLCLLLLESLQLRKLFLFKSTLTQKLELLCLPFLGGLRGTRSRWRLLLLLLLLLRHHGSLLGDLLWSKLILHSASTLGPLLHFGRLLGGTRCRDGRLRRRFPLDWH